MSAAAPPLSDAPMKIAVAGLGAMGGMIAALLARGGAEVSGLARGATLEAVRSRGLVLDFRGERHEARIAVDDDPAALGVQDAVIIAVKEPALAGLAPSLTPMIGPETAIVTAMNGLSWWFFHGLGGRRIACLDPEGRIEAALPSRQAVGAVLHLWATVPEPGRIDAGPGDRVILGSPGAMDTAALAAAFEAGGFKVQRSDDIRAEVWSKLLGNLSGNPISAVTGATLDRILSPDGALDAAMALMAETTAVGRALGIEPVISLEARVELGRSLGAFKTSMLQDFENAKPPEIAALLTCVSEIGAAEGVPTPLIDAMRAIVTLRADTAGLL